MQANHDHANDVEHEVILALRQALQEIVPHGDQYDDWEGFQKVRDAVVMDPKQPEQ